MHLSTLYGNDLGVLPSTPIIKEHFFPLPYEKYITFHNSDKVQSKSYSYWTDVFDIIRPFLNDLGIKIVQVGSPSDKIVDGVDFFVNYTTFKQSFHIIKNGIMHLGIDSSPVHIASVFNKPTVSIYAHTYAATCYPLWNDKKVMIESHRNGKKPSFSLFEEEKTIDLIMPEEIAQAVLDLLGANQTVSHKTLYIGKKFLNKEIHFIPSSEMPPLLNDDNIEMFVRVDVAHDEDFLFSLLNNTDKAINIICSQTIKDRRKLMFFKHKIKSIQYYQESFNEEFLNFLKESAFKIQLTCVSKETLEEQRLKFFDIEIDYLDMIGDFVKKRNKYRSLLDGDFKIKTGRVYMIGSNKFKTLGENVDDLKFWLDFDHFMVYND